MSAMQQTPAPGACLVRHRGDVLTVRLAAPPAQGGRAFLRTNAGRAAVRRREIIRHVEAGEPILDCDWHDLPMRPDGEGGFACAVPLREVGRVEAKAYWLAEGSAEPAWPAGGNVTVKVEPADTVAGNTLYSAFVRQFGPDRFHDAAAADHAAEAAPLDGAGYAVIPPSGTFRALGAELDTILGTLGFRVLQLLPVHPVPTTYARMGRFGSPFAVMDFEEIDPALAEFDRRTTPLDQFRELLDGVHARHGKVFLDIPLNHTGWASRLQIHRPEWFARGADRTFESPGAWGVTWEDLSRLDYRHRALWTHMAGVLLYWCRQGVDGFRCDAGYMIPVPVWTYLAAKVRAEYPDTVFLLEGLGGKAATVERLLDEANLDWAYSELFQVPDRGGIDAYLPGCLDVSRRKGLLLHFAETHDNDRLAARSPAHARLRTALAALCCDSGGFGITNGVEWFATEKVDVHGAPSLNWGAPENQTAAIRRLNAILRAHPCFRAGAALRPAGTGPGNVVVVVRKDPGGARLLAAANLDEGQPARAEWDAADFDAPDGGATDLLTGEPVPLETAGARRACALGPAGVLCLSADADDAGRVTAWEGALDAEPEACRMQRLRACALDVLAGVAPDDAERAADPGATAQRLREAPDTFAEWASGGAPRTVRWQWPRDTRRRVPVPPGWALCLRAPDRFRVEARDGAGWVRREHSLPAEDGSHFAVLLPPAAKAARVLAMDLTVYANVGVARERAEALCLPGAEEPVVRHRTAPACRAAGTAVLAANRRGAMTLARADWGALQSRYDAWLAVNPAPRVPADRRIGLVRCRGWVVYRGYSQELNTECLRAFGRGPEGEAVWRFEAPCGMGRKVGLTVRLRLDPDANTVTVVCARTADADDAWLDPGASVSVILRPDLEARNAHDVTRAYAGPEHAWPAAVTPSPDGFRFAPDPAGCALTLRVAPGAFTPEPEWQYMTFLPAESERGMEATTDLFSPGYFTLALRGGGSAVLRADADGAAPPPAKAVPPPAAPEDGAVSLGAALREAMQAYIARRDDTLTVLAGFPWFLDWGRDTLICLRGMVAAGLHAEVEAILLTFARFEEQGTLPNMIRGADASNRDTSDAPLWFLVACADAVAARPDSGLLARDAGGRTVGDVCVSIANGYRRGTPNGIRVDPASGLVFSPSHFTWMDTNHPAGTPREGYPIEIQALWHAGLRFLAAQDPHGDWADLAGTVCGSIRRYFADGAPPGIGLRDCLHCAGYSPAADARGDDHLRPNQLLALTLGAVVDAEAARRSVAAAAELVVPGALRSLADRPVRFALPVERDGVLLNDPARPYWGRYGGDEDTRRKPAYHNGTAWTWLFPSYPEALVRVHGLAARDAALALLRSSAALLGEGVLGQIPEILDGDAPHAERGCAAQAWGVTELYRVLAFLDGVA
jgi:starch synthase (maltosyl-transferring)